MSALYGLLLAGGRSTRMGADKAALRFGGRSQLERAWSLMAPRVERAFLSVRPEQCGEPLRARYPQLVDEPGASGPIAGLLAAQAAYPRAAWLVLACDLPRLDGAALDELLAARDPARIATAYAGPEDGLPEPLCAVWEPSSRSALAAYVASGGHCPRRFLRGRDTKLIAATRPATLENANTPEDAQHAGAELPREETA